MGPSVSSEYLGNGSDKLNLRLFLPTNNKRWNLNNARETICELQLDKLCVYFFVFILFFGTKSGKFVLMFNVSLVGEMKTK